MKRYRDGLPWKGLKQSTGVSYEYRTFGEIERPRGLDGCCNELDNPSFFLKGGSSRGVVAGW